MGSHKGKADTLRVLCDGIIPKSVKASFALYKLLDESVVYPPVAGPAIKPPNGAEQEGVDVTVLRTDGGSGVSQWLKFQFDKNLDPDQNYELRFSGTSQFDDNSGRIDSFSSTRFRFSTSPEAAIAVNNGNLEIQSNTVLNITAAGKLTDQSKKPDTVYTLQSGCDDPGDPDCVGRINLVGAGNRPVSELGTKLELQEVTDIFGRPVTLKPYKPAPPAVAPKSKDAAAWYFNFLHQAGGGITPTWIADIKAAPVLGALPGQMFFTPSLVADVGSGQVGTTKTNDLINPKAGVSRLFLTNAGVLSAVKFTPSLSWQTNREGTNQSVLFDGDIRLYFRQLSNTKADRTLDNLLTLRRTGYPKEKIPANPKALPQDARKAIFGYDLQFYIGTEAGSSLTANSVKSSDKSSQVTVPSYSIARLRPRAVATFEFWNLTASVSTTPRYLFDTEAVTRQTLTIQPTGPAKETIRLSDVSGWRGYVETSISYAADPAGHYSVNATWKLGSLPTNFDRVNMVQSGLLVRF